MLENLNLRSRILLGYGIPVILSIVSSGIVYSRVTMVQQQTTLTHKSYEVLDKAQKLALSVQIMDRAVRGHLLDRSSISLETYEQARTTYQALAEAGLSIPGDVAVAGFDDLEFASQLDPPLTTVRQGVGEIGHEAARTLLSLLENRESGPRRVLLPTELVVRGSSA